MDISNSHAALLTTQGMGHIIPSLELAKRLVTHHITPKLTLFIGSIKSSSVSKAEIQVLQSATKENLFDIIQLPPLEITDFVASNASIETKVAITMHEIPKLFISTISTLQLKPTIIIIDSCLSQAITLAKEFKVPKFVFSPTNAWFLALCLYTPSLDKKVQGQYSDETKPISIPGCKSLHPNDLFQILLDRTHRVYHECLGACNGIALANGILVNTFQELEPKTLTALGSGEIAKMPVYAIGPIIRETSRPKNEDKGSEVFEWLDKQEEESVIYVSLGSGYNMSYEQTKEMALGLELSGKKFVWSLRACVTKAGNDHYFTAGEDNETKTKTNSEFDSFLDEFHNIRKNGIVVRDWAPQVDILKHSSIGGFVSHCGWNSVIESVSCGVPIVGLPLFGEQRMNAAMLAEEVGIGVRVEVSMSTNLFGKEELAKAIKKIMDKEDKEGCEMRKKVKELEQAAQRAWSHDGSSYCALTKIIH